MFGRNTEWNVKTANLAVFLYTGWVWPVTRPPRDGARAPRPARGRGMRAGSYISESEHLRCGSGGQGPAIRFRLRGSYRALLDLGRRAQGGSGLVGSSPSHVPPDRPRRLLEPRNDFFFVLVTRTRHVLGWTEYVGVVVQRPIESTSSIHIHPAMCSLRSQPVDGRFPSPRQLSLRSLTLAAVRCRSTTCQP
jgi:hypothetical protein